MLFPSDALRSFILRVGPIYSKERINQFANRVKIHPGVIVGQLQKRKEISYAANREMLVKVREYVTSTAVTDGWGTPLIQGLSNEAKREERADYMRELLDDYLAAHGNMPVDPNDLFRWARRNGRWEPAARSLYQQFKDELQRAAREDFYTDPQGRTVRRKHAIVVKEGETQHSLWADIETAPPEHMKLSLQQCRRGCLGDVKQLKTDMDSYNENNNPGAPIQMSFNFDPDLEEMEEEGTYPDAPSEENEEDED